MPDAYDPTSPVQRVFERLADIIAGGTIATLDFTSISQQYEHLLLICQLRGAKAATSDTVALTVNGVTAAYDAQAVSGAAATPASAEALNAAAIAIGPIAAASATAGISDYVELLIPNYARTTLQKVVKVIRSQKIGTSTGNIDLSMFIGYTRATTAISQITLTPGTTGFAVGSRASLYGVGKA